MHIYTIYMFIYKTIACDNVFTTTIIFLCCVLTIKNIYNIIPFENILYFIYTYNYHLHIPPNNTK